MGDTLDETPPARRDKPQTLNIGHEEEGIASASATTPSSSIVIPASRIPRNRLRHADRDQIRDHSSDGLVSSGERRDEFMGLDAQPRRESLNSCEAGSPMAMSSSPGKAGRLNSSRYPSGATGGGIGVSVLGGLVGTTTRKCVLTLDGYSYVIVASTPESLPSKRDEASVGAGTTGGTSGAASSSSGAASGGASGSGGPTTGAGTGTGGAGGVSTPAQEAVSPTVSELSGSGTNATINGQVARHGSLTIIRRTNSRNFTQNDPQLASPSTTASSSTVPGIGLAQTPLSEPLAERLSFRSGSNGSASVGDSRSSNQGPYCGPSANANAANVKMQPSSPNATNYTADNIQITSVNLSQTEIVAGRDSTDYTTVHSLNAGAGTSFLRGETDNPQESGHSFETTSNTSFVAGQWDTESLPPVDTPDALNKAAGRIRSLLRRMDHETVAYEDMQRNLHYAARVLEAVFIDESRSPTTGKTKLGQIASSSVESEEEGCNGNCKNLNCSRHSHGRDDQQQDNNNSNSSCSLQEGAPGGAGATPAGDNQDSIESRTKGVSLAPQTHSGPTGPPASTETSSATPPASKLQPALETVRESVMEESPSKDPGEKAAPQPTPEPSAKAAESSLTSGSGSSGSCSNPATVHRQRRLRTPTWARSMSTNKTYLKFDF